MKRRRVIVVVGACVVIAIVAVVLWPGEREPEYGGKKLSEWLDQYHPYTNFKFIPGQQEEAIAAVRSIGTNGLPFMLRWLRYSDGPNQIDRIAGIYAKLPERLQSRSIDRYLVRHGGRAYSQAAFNGLLILGREAGSALPELQRMAGDTNFPRTAQDARFVLRHMDPEGDLLEVHSQRVGTQSDSELVVRADSVDVARTNRNEGLVKGVKH